MKKPNTDTPARRTLVSLRTLADEWDADRTTVRRLLRAAGVKPVVLGTGRNASIRYQADEVWAYLRSRRQTS